MNRHFLTWVLLVVTFMGIADSWYLGFSEETGATLTCNIKGLNGCNAVAQSVYSHVFGIPVGLIGLAFYSVVFICGAYLLFYSNRTVYKILHILAWAGLIASAIFVFIQFFLIKALCIYCLGSAAISFVVCLVAIQLWVRHAPHTPRVSTLQT